MKARDEWLELTDARLQGHGRYPCTVSTAIAPSAASVCSSREGGETVFPRRIVVKTTTVEAAERGRSPLGSHIRFLLDGPHGNLIHATVPPGMVGRACRFRTIEEYWYVLSGEGEMWRRAPDGEESVTRLTPGVSVDIPQGTAFQYRCRGTAPLVCTVTAMPPWPGDDEAVVIEGPWVPDVGPDEEGLHSVWSRD